MSAFGVSNRSFLKVNFVALLVSFSFFGCSSALYHPTKIVYGDPKAEGIVFEEISLSTKNEESIHAWLLRNRALKKQPKGIVVFFHGNAENLTSHYRGVSWLLDYEYDVFIFDYQGYGKSTGKPSPINTVEDGKRVLDEVHRRYPESVPLIVFAQSLGGAVALRSVAEWPLRNRIKAIAVEGSFSSYQEAGKKVLSSTWVTWLLQPLAYVLLSDAAAPVNKLHLLRGIPILVMHGDRDFVVHFDLGRELFLRLPEPKTFWRVCGGRHMTTFWIDEPNYRSYFVKWLEEPARKDLPIFDERFCESARLRDKP